MGTITSFQTATNSYTFPAYGDQSYKDNFANLVARTTRLPGAHGGYDEYGYGRAPSEVGSVQQNVVLRSATRNGMQPLRDALKQIADWGVGRLFFQPTDTNLTPRWCWARVNNIGMSEERNKHTDLIQRVQINWQVSDPFWYTAGNETLWDGGSLWDAAGVYWDGGTGTNVVNSNTFSITNNGNAFTLARLTIYNTSGSNVWYPIIQRTVNSVVVDEVRYQGAIPDGYWLEIDSRAHRAILTNGSSYSSAYANLTFKHPDWLRLLPGANTLPVTFSGTANVQIRYYERYV